MKNRIFIISLAFMLLIGAAPPQRKPRRPPLPLPRRPRRNLPRRQRAKSCWTGRTPRNSPPNMREHFPALPYGQELARRQQDGYITIECDEMGQGELLIYCDMLTEAGFAGSMGSYRKGGG